MQVVLGVDDPCIKNAALYLATVVRVSFVDVISLTKPVVECLVGVNCFREETDKVDE